MGAVCWLGGLCIRGDCVWFVEPSHCRYHDVRHRLSKEAREVVDFCWSGGEITERVLNRKKPTKSEVFVRESEIEEEENDDLDEEATYY